MRDPKRIKPILDQLAALWTSKPDLRLGQLILNVAKAESPKDSSYEEMNRIACLEGVDIYNVEDEELIKRISEYIKKG